MKNNVIYTTATFNPVQLLNTAFNMVGVQKAEELGIYKINNGNFDLENLKVFEVKGSFNFEYVQRFEVEENIPIHGHNPDVNLYERDGKFYGSIVTQANLDVSGQRTWSYNDTIPTIVIAPEEQFGKGVNTKELSEVTAESIHLYQASLHDGSVQSLLIIETSGMFGLDDRGYAYNIHTGISQC